jgi:hypothetical protein
MAGGVALDQALSRHGRHGLAGNMLAYSQRIGLVGEQGGVNAPPSLAVDATDDPCNQWSSLCRDIRTWYSP